jgi:predicted porin
MKRTLLVASLALLSAGAYAQNSVTVYGRLNVTAESQKSGGGKRVTELNNNSSRIGFKGNEDLGGGMNAGFVIEHGFDPTDGTAASTFWGRESTVYLGGGWGKVNLGRMAASESYFATVDYVSMHNHDTGTSSDALAAFIATGQFKNAVGYYSPNMGGFNFSVQTAEKVNPTGNRPLGLAANYDAGPLHLGFGMEKFGSGKSFNLRGLYEMGALTFGGYIERATGEYNGNANPDSAKGNALRLAVKYSVGASDFHLNGGRVSSTTNNGSGRLNGSQYTLGYNYNLSKRTKVYTYYTNLNLTGTASDFNSFALGVRHNF